MFSRVVHVLFAERGVGPLHLDDGTVDNGRDKGELLDSFVFEGDVVSDERVQKLVCCVVEVVVDCLFACHVRKTKRFQCCRPRRKKDHQKQ